MHRKSRLTLFCLLLTLTLGGCQSQGPEMPELLDMADRIDEILRQTREATCSLAQEASSVLGDPEACKAGVYPEERYRYYQNTVYFTPEDDGGCAVWASGVVPVDAALRTKIRTLEHLDPFIKLTAGTTRFIAQSYVMIKESVGVVYPFYDTVAFLPPLLDFNESFLPFNSAGPEHNPERAPVWIEPYIDALGKGYTVTVSCPFFVGERFEGVAGSDMPLLPIRKALLDGEEAGYVILAGGMLPAASNALAEELLSMPGLGEYYYLEEVKEDVHASDSYKLVNAPDPEVRALAERLVSVREAETFTWNIGGRQLQLSVCPIAETGWLLVRILARSAARGQSGP
jgi:hypothetical protein